MLWKYLKGVPFFNERYTEGEMGIKKSKGADLGAEPPRIELCRVIPPPRWGERFGPFERFKSL